MRAKESVLRNNLFTLRTQIDEFTYDKHKAPQTLQEMVSEGYLRSVPMDPITGSADSWKIIMEDAASTASQSQPGIFDVRSGSPKTRLEGTPHGKFVLTRQMPLGLNFESCADNRRQAGY